MPIYRFRCCSCGVEFRELLAYGDGKAINCPECGSGEVEKLLPRFGVIYKGSGFYTTDYRRGGEGSGDSGKGEKEGDGK